MPKEPFTTLSAATEADLPALVQQLLALAAGCKVWFLEGQLGAGKTSLAKALVAVLGSADHVSSPTYSLVNEYALPGGEPLYHIDLYRLRGGVAEAMEMGLDSYLYSSKWCVVEWGSVAEAIKPERYLHIQIDVQSDGSRAYLVSNQ
jgi:tRNA threonylcarbamoyladenosine biosynthesis protein TsaE